jgi:hypothetical protein
MLLAVAAEVAWSSPVDFSSENSRLHDAIRSEVGLASATLWILGNDRGGRPAHLSACARLMQ